MIGIEVDLSYTCACFHHHILPIHNSNLLVSCVSASCLYM